MIKRLLSPFVAAICLLLAACSSSQKAKKVNSSSEISTVEKTSLPNAQREFRAAWVATVANINWPSKPGLSTAQQQKEAIELLDFLKNHHFNAVIFQVRPQADALYQSDLEPWSYYLTREQGKAPSPYYDPLAFWVKEAHDRGIELHVWLNPYRAHHIAGGPIGDKSVVKTKSNAVVHLKEGYWWFDPSLKETQDHGVNVVMDIVKRYDIDGVHFDDYFYPYKSYNNNDDFPDSTSWNNYLAAGGKLSRSDWRRESVNTFIARLYTEIKKEKKHVKFGLSPFGIWRPGYPESIEGMDQYEDLYADAKLWLNKGWVDYFAPQLYWPIGKQQQSFPILLRWWSEENTLNRHLWPGISVSRDTNVRNQETLNQILVSRGMLPKSEGVIHWSISTVVRNAALSQALIDGPYKKKALAPASPWLDNVAPAKPSVTISQPKENEVKISWSHKYTKDVFKWVVYYRYGGKWNYEILYRGTNEFKLPSHDNKNRLTEVIVTAVDRVGNESDKEVITTNVLAIVPKAAWNAAEAKPYKKHTPTKITIHHEGGRVLADTADARVRLKNVQTWSMGPDRKWSDIPYHYLIAPDGTVFEGRDPLTVGETNTEYDPAGHLLISFLGNYQQQSISTHQVEILTKLIAQFCKQYNISPETIGAHKDYSKITTCPGDEIYAYIQSGYLKKKVKELLN